MRILHTADWHVGELTGPVVNGRNARMMDTLKCVDFLTTKALEEDVDAILIAGDIFDKSKLWADNMLEQFTLVADHLRIATRIPVVLMFGTANHDNDKAFFLLDDMRIPGLTVLRHPEIRAIQTKSGPLQVAAVPGLDKGYYRSKFPGMAPEEENRMCSQLLGDIILGLGAQVDPLIPSVLMSHYTVVGCELDNGQHIFTQSDVVLPKGALAASPFDLVALGHIHRAQEVSNCGRPVFYSGSINGITFNEEGQDKGFWIHEIDAGLSYGNVSSEFVKTPSREFLTLEAEDEIDWFIEHGIESWFSPGSDWGCPYFPSPEGKIVRVHYTCSDETNKKLNRKALEKALYEAGAFYVAEIKPVQVIASLVKQEMSENDGPLENLAAWSLAEGLTAEETTALIELAKPLLDTVSAKMPTGKLSGIFEPKRLEVKNYRSYREEEFDFSEIFFATVNGPNGIGKSAFFMDAICDALYEEPREGELTGWITTGEDVKSGSMTFEFGMGDTDWRVIRTRAKSGKTTLALQQLVEGQWENRSAEKVKDTQDKIIALLGMDCATFRCVALIMQDAYGLFMEADKTERMEVLANILGLNIYEQLAELAKGKVTEVNRELTKAKEKLADLDMRLKDKDDTEAILTKTNEEIQVLASDIQAKETALKEAEELVRQLNAKFEKAKELQGQVETLAKEITTKQQEKDGQQAHLDRAKKMLDAEEQILAKAAEYEQVKEQVTVLKTKQPRLTDMKAEEQRIGVEQWRVTTQINDLSKKISHTESLLSNRDELTKAVEQYRETTKSLEGMDELADKWAAIDLTVREAKAAWEKANIELTAKTESLEKEIQGLKSKVTMLDDSGCIHPEKASCRFLADAQEAKVRLVAAQAEYEALDVDAVAQLKEEYHLQELRRDSLGYDQQEHRRLKELVSELRPKAEQAAQLSAKDELLKTLQAQKTQLNEQNVQLLERLSSVTAETATLQEELKPLAEMEARLPKLEAWVKSKEELPAARQVVTTATEWIEVIDREITTKLEQSKALESERLALTSGLANSIDAAKADVQLYQNQIKQLQDEQNALHAKVGGLKVQLEALQKDEEERQRLLTEMEPTAKELVRYQTLSKAFGFDGIPFSIVRSVVPELAAQANEILAQMTGGKMSLDMKTERVQKSNKKEVNALEIWITDYQRGTLPYLSRSGGQRVKAALSVAFALADLKARRAGIQLGMLFIDEPSFLDAEGVDAYCDALELLSQRYPNMKVIAISHDLKMISRFPQVINVIDAGEEGSKVFLVA